MFSRKNGTTSSTIPEQIIILINKIINDSFKTNFDSKNIYLETFGELYEDEILLIFSLLDKDDSNSNTISLFISDEIDPKTDLEKKVNELINASSEFFELLCSGTDEQLSEMYSPRWQKSTSGNEGFYFKISRENVRLTIEANKILGES
tara:strand:+ start:204 stop:650 length:447 start_codon:yes stop_codon:yes gene_type:complete